MKHINKKAFISGLAFLGLFLIFTILVIFVDKKPIGVNGTEVGLATMNKAFANSIEVNFNLYFATDWGSIPAILTGIIFGILGLVQWIKRKKLFDVDTNLIVLGIFYIVLLIFFLFFKYVVINYRPVLIDGKAESSYPSSTTLLSIGFMSTAILNNYKYIKKKWLVHTISLIEFGYMLFLLIGRLMSGVHWLSDIIGSVILASASFLIYLSLFKIGNQAEKKENEEKN